MTPPHHLLDGFDRWVGAASIHTSGLNWKGRAIQRAWLLSARASEARHRGANSLRSVIRSLSLRPVLRALDVRIRVPAEHLSGLNWKGRTLERALALRAAIPRLSWGLARRALRLPGLPRMTRHDAAMRASRIINRAGFAFYSTLARFRRHQRVKSVLQISFISHKPFMVSRAMRTLGLKSDCLMLNVGADAGILNLGYDYAIRADVSPRKRFWLEHYYLWMVMARYDVIHSHFKTFLSDSGWELEYLKKLGKVLVFHYRGCDIRHRSLNMKVQPELNCCQECDYPVGSCDIPYQFRQMATARKYGDLFFVTTPDLRDFAEGAEHIPFMHPVGIDFAAIEAAPRDPEIFRVVTSSNHHGIDGTRFIRDAVQRLQAEGWRIELVEVNKMPYRQALSVYKSADVYAGKLRMGYYNNANIETMMLGVPNMSYVRKEFESLVPDSPIINTRPETVYDRLREYIDKRDELKSIGARGPEFVRKHHAPEVVLTRIIDRYNEAFTAIHNHVH